MSGSARRKLPIGIQTFRRIREDGCYYVDKTGFVRDLIDRGSRYFLSRPRRFGKSLLVDTLKELFEGSEELFRGLAIHPHWDWATRHPVVRLSFGRGSFRRKSGVRLHFREQIDGAARRRGLEIVEKSASGRFAALLEALHRASGRRVVVLVDEYDKPILDTLGDPGVARSNRDFLRDVYGTIKDCDEHVHFAFLTGVSRFSKVNLFSGLNNLNDITLHPPHSAICGYTDQDIDTVFAPELPGLDRDRIRRWYNGYSWLGDQVYNPLDVLLLFERRKFDAYWFETGTPTFLLETLVKRGVSSATLGESMGDAQLLSAFDVEDMAPEALLFQTGYLTISGVTDLGGMPLYRLGYPNHEVRQSLNRNLLRYLVRDARRQGENSVRLRRLLQSRDFEGMRALFQSFFASIPYEWYTNNDIARFEGYYASVFYSYFAALGLDIAVEDSTSHGRLDMAVRFGGDVFLFEFKVVEMEPDGSAMAQLRERDYAAKHRGGGGEVFLVGVEFSRRTRNVVGFEVGRG